jgi:hypothetical protein
MTNGLVAELVATRPLDLVALPRTLSQWWIDEFASRFVADRGAYWWWRFLTVEVSVHDYGTADGLQLIEDLAVEWGPCVLIVTDEEPVPAGCVFGLVPEITAALRNVRHFEFVLLPTTLDRWLFDTHHNRLLEFR